MYVYDAGVTWLTRMYLNLTLAGITGIIEFISSFTVAGHISTQGALTGCVECIIYTTCLKNEINECLMFSECNATYSEKRKPTAASYGHQLFRVFFF